MSTTALAAVLAKFAGLNAAAKGAVGLAVAAGAVGAAGGVPVLVDEVSGGTDEVAIVEPVTEDVVDDDSPAEPAGEEPADDADAVTDPEDGTEEEPTDGSVPGPDHELPAAAAFGQSVAADARDGGVVGQEIAERAKEAAQERRTAREDAPETPEAPEGTAPDAGEPAAVVPAPAAPVEKPGKRP